jgi:cellulose synthase/poly-beta-1,6-N-acetylglucosamine synthase-like glycosyltransferase
VLRRVQPALQETEENVQAPRIGDAELPIYTILVPLFREAKVLGALVESLRRLDYPAAKLDIK